MVLALAIGYIFFFYSERMFWSFLRADDTLLSQIPGWLVYSLFAYMTLAIIQHFRVRSIYALFLAGVVFGWIVEGIYAMTFFGGGGIPLPFSIIWTGVAWHALISVTLGWYVLQKSLAERSYLHSLSLSALFGLFWGVWAVAWVFETPPVTTTAGGFVAHAFATTALLSLAFWLLPKLRPESFTPTRIERYVLGALAVSFFALVTIPSVLFPAVILVVAFAVIYFLLRRHRKSQHDSVATILSMFQKPVPMRKYFTIFAMPLVASATYIGLNGAGLVFRSNLPMLVVTCLVGTTLLFVSSYTIIREK